MELQSLKVTTREVNGKGDARRIRKAGAVPAVLYGLAEDPVSFKLDLRTFEHVVHGRGGEHAIVQLEVQDKPKLNCPALLKDVQHHPVSGSILHADFLRIRLDMRINTIVPVHLTGHAKGLVAGGVLDHQLRELDVECIALDVPDELTVDVSDLEIGDNVHVSDSAAPENVVIVTDPSRTVVSVHAPRVVKEEEVEAEAAEAEGELEEEAGPEVIGEKKEEE